MKLHYDFHLHSCLSPCGSDDMTPFNLVNMAKLLDLDIIALTDHNNTGNCRSAMTVGHEVGITVVPGMELCTAEEIHVVCLFSDIESADAFSGYIRSAMPPFPNDPRAFGRQLYMDERDNILGDEEILLVTASDISIDSVPRLVEKYGGFCYPAHIDRPAYSILSSLGVIEADMGFTCAEISEQGDESDLKHRYPALRGMRIMRSSDAHYLENMREAADTITLPENTPQALIAYLRGLYPQ